MMSVDGVVALLPMKRNSERVPGKNFREIAGKPLFAWVLETLLGLAEIRKIIINTDARSLLERSKVVDKERIYIRDRRSGLCGDDVSMNRVLADDLEHVCARAYLMTHVTNPLLSGDTIKEALASYSVAVARGTADSLFSVNRIQARFYRADGTPVNHDPAELIQTQRLEPWFEENSGIYIFTRESFDKAKSRIGVRPMLYETPKIESIDIDDPQEWQIAEALLEARERRSFK